MFGDHKCPVISARIDARVCPQSSFSRGRQGRAGPGSTWLGEPVAGRVATNASGVELPLECRLPCGGCVFKQTIIIAPSANDTPPPTVAYLGSSMPANISYGELWHNKYTPLLCVARLAWETQRREPGGYGSRSTSACCISCRSVGRWSQRSLRLHVSRRVVWKKQQAPCAGVTGCYHSVFVELRAESIFCGATQIRLDMKK